MPLLSRHRLSSLGGSDCSHMSSWRMPATTYRDAECFPCRIRGSGPESFSCGFVSVPIKVALTVRIPSSNGHLVTKDGGKTVGRKCQMIQALSDKFRRPGERGVSARPARR